MGKAIPRRSSGGFVSPSRAILFLCPDGASRGPLAEALANHLDPAGTYVCAALAPGHVRRAAREVLSEEGVEATGLRARSLREVDLAEFREVILLDELAPAPRLPAHLSLVRWPTPDPLCAPPAEQREALRATRDRLLDRLRRHLLASSS